MRFRFLSILCVMMLFTGCEEQEVEKIVYGKDYCDQCRMQISDKRYGGAFLTKTGKTLKFDAVECMAERKDTGKDDIKTIYFVDFETSELKSRDKVHLYKNESMHGPMGTHIQAWSKAQALPEIKFEEVKR